MLARHVTHRSHLGLLDHYSIPNSQYIFFYRENFQHLNAKFHEILSAFHRQIPIIKNKNKKEERKTQGEVNVVPPLKLLRQQVNNCACMRCL